MNTLTIRLPDDLAERIKNAAQARGISVNKFITEISLQALATQDAETRFRMMAAKANIPDAIDVLDRLERTE